MLQLLTIHNFVTIERVEIAFAQGLTVLTGETGAGKSILLDALGLIIGGRAENRFIRAGASQADIHAVFNVSAWEEVQAWLSEREWGNGQECLVRRVLPADAPSRAYINGNPCMVHDLKSLGALLVDIYGQNEHQSLLQREKQYAFLDAAIGITALAEEVKTLAHKGRDVQKELATLSAQQNGSTANQELMRYQLEELESLALEQCDIAALEDEQKQLEQAECCIQAAQMCLDALDNENGGAQQRVQDGITQLKNAASHTVQPMLELLTETSEQIEEAITSIRRYCERLSPDPERLEQLNQRLDTIYRVAHKHRLATDELPALQERLIKDLDALQQVDDKVSDMQHQLDELNALYGQKAQQLSTTRQGQAPAIAQKITDILASLFMAHCTFTIALSARNDADTLPLHGLERIDYAVATAPNQPPHPLAKIASGGELSRIGLAIQIVGSVANCPTIIFDEVDAGIGGGVAEIVGTMLRTLSEHGQVLCVTHLAQVAGKAHHHIAVSKKITDNEVSTHTTALDEDQRIEELARMSGGVELTAQTRAHAKDLLGLPAKKGK